MFINVLGACGLTLGMTGPTAGADISVAGRPREEDSAIAERRCDEDFSIVDCSGGGETLCARCLLNNEPDEGGCAGAAWPDAEELAVADRPEDAPFLSFFRPEGADFLRPPILTCEEELSATRMGDAREKIDEQ